MGLISSLTSKLKNKGPLGSTGSDASQRGKRSGRRVRNPPEHQGPRNRGPQNGPDGQGPNRSQRPGEPGQGPGNPQAGPDQGRRGPGPAQSNPRNDPAGPRGPQEFDDPFEDNPFDDDPFGDEPDRFGGSENVGPGQERDMPTSSNTMMQTQRRDQQRQDGPGADRSRGGRDQPPAPRHYNLDLPLDEDEPGGDDLHTELRQIMRQNERIIDLLEQIRNRGR